MSEKSWEEAIILFKELLEYEPDSHIVMEAIAACHDGNEDYLRAAEYFEKTLATCPQERRFDVSYRLGVVRACAERIEKAEDAFRNCIEWDPGNAEKQQVSEILELLAQMREGTRNKNFFRVQVQLQRAFSDMEEDEYAPAAARLERLTEVDPDNASIFYNLGVVYTFLKREDDAMESFRRCVDLHPDYFQAWYNMGQISMIVRKDFSQALNYFSQATAIRPDYVSAHHQSGIASELLGDKERAVKCWERTLELDPDNKQAQENIARVSGQPKM
jgi:tetratricopeptide (TPR) repeat protein